MNISDNEQIKACSVQTYVHEPMICAFGVITNAISASVFSSPKMKDVSFKYLLAISISDMFYLGINSYWFSYYCEQFSLNKTYSANVYKLYLREYLGRCFAIFSVITEVLLSLERYMVLLNKSYLKEKTHKSLIVACLALSFVYYSPLLALRKIALVNDSVYSVNKTVVNSTTLSPSYRLVGSGIASQTTRKVIPIVLICFRYFLVTIVFPCINILNVYEFRKRYLGHPQKTTIETGTGIYFKE